MSKMRVSLSQRGDEIRGTVELPGDPAFVLEGLSLVIERFAQQSGVAAGTIHAETNAIMFASRPVAGCTIYVTHPPCAKCAAVIIQSGIARVVSRPPWNSFTDRWADDIKSANEMFIEAGVTFDYVGGSK